jgi:hypothetical protein
MSTEQKTAVKQVRLLFMAQQVLSLLDCTKTVTRRPVREQLSFLGHKRLRLVQWDDPTMWGCLGHDGAFLTLAAAAARSSGVIRHRYGQAGDELVGTESHRVFFDGSGRCGLIYRADGGIFYPDDVDCIDYLTRLWDRGRRGWRPPRFLPNWASRLRREIVSIEPQRLLEIACGRIEAQSREVRKEGVGWPGAPTHPTRFFLARWEEIYGKEFPYKSDPWIRRIEFRPWPAGVAA